MLHNTYLHNMNNVNHFKKNNNSFFLNIGIFYLISIVVSHFLIDKYVKYVKFSS